MRSRLFILALLQFAALTPVRAQIDFKPLVREYTAGGFVHRELTFKSEKATVTFAPPAKWSIRGESSRFRMSPPNKDLVEVSIQNLVGPMPPSFDEAGLAALEQLALREAPPGSQSVQVASRGANTIVIGPNPSFEFAITYQTLGQTFQKSVIFVGGPVPLLVQFAAPKADYGKLDGEFRQSICSWQWLDRPQNGAAPALASK
jgi:hypothetical protein